MIIQLDSTTTGNVKTAHRSLEALTGSWGHPITETTAIAVTSHPNGDSKAIDPIAVATLLLSIPQAALSVLDLALLGVALLDVDLGFSGRAAEARMVDVAAHVPVDGGEGVA